MSVDTSTAEHPEGAIAVKAGSARLTKEAAAAATTAAQALGISRDAYIEQLLLRDARQRDARGRPRWWGPRTAPKWWVDPDYRVTTRPSQTRRNSKPGAPATA